MLRVANWAILRRSVCTKVARSIFGLVTRSVKRFLDRLCLGNGYMPLNCAFCEVQALSSLLLKASPKGRLIQLRSRKTWFFA